MVETCPTCGGARGPGSDRPPCLCELSPMAPAEPEAPAARSGEGHAKALRCPSCGGWLEQGVRRCGYCRVELASVRCWRCFDLSFAGTTACASCGATLGLEGDMGPTDDRCPGCAADTLHVIVVGDHRIRECPACAGVMVDHDTLERITHAREAEAGVRLTGGPRKAELTIEPVRYRRCPTCARVMTRRNFGRSSGVIVDVCKDHGVWFDPDELTQVLDFVASGGLEQRRQRDMDEARLELSRRRIDAMNEQMRASRSVYETPGVHSGGALLGALVGWSW
ncbi:MAG TPA: zf-TFIIB domain-containing protein [Sandaracinaceae bacterium LLY-WYZ-13_1]|nr:zf-TFIIB domain-containing protein [Sandaracinaceae bacterium LLY-WYZ-13_1]